MNGYDNCSLSPVYDQLLGALIGLVRAADNNEDLVTAETGQLVLEVLNATKTLADINVLKSLHDRIVSEKKRIVPDCFQCQSPCGRTDDYDMKLIRDSKEKSAWIKIQILAELQKSAADISPTAARMKFFYKALYLIGVDLDAEDLMPVLEEAEKQYI